MRITYIGTDYVNINEDNLYDYVEIPKIHLIKFDFNKPSEEKIKKVLSLYPKTNRFVVEKDVRLYNYVLKYTNKKYYVSNMVNNDIISFFRKNNKVLINFHNFNEFEKQFFLMDNVFIDMLKNTEVIHIDKNIFDEKMHVLDKWRGNCIISGEDE